MNCAMQAIYNGKPLNHASSKVIKRTVAPSKSNMMPKVRETGLAALADNLKKPNQVMIPESK